MAKESVSTKKKRSSLIKRLLVFIGLVIIAINLVQYLFIMSNARKNIVEEDIDMYRNMSEGYASALENELEGYFKELNGYVFADIMKPATLSCATSGSWIQSIGTCTASSTISCSQVLTGKPGRIWAA